MRLKKVKLEQAVGSALAHDLTRIVPGQVKETAFRRGQVIAPEDVGMLLDMGRESLYVLHLGPGELHENDAAVEMARHLMGPNLKASAPAEGKVNLTATVNGLLKIEVKSQARLNSMPPLTLSTLHTKHGRNRGPAGGLGQDRAPGGPRALPAPDGETGPGQRLHRPG